jgi:beta-glucosidase
MQCANLSILQYLQLGGDENPFGVLRGFDEVPLEPGEAKMVVFNVTRRDISNWNTTTQNWEINDKDKFMFIGASARLFHLNATLPRLTEEATTLEIP